MALIPSSFKLIPKYFWDSSGDMRSALTIYFPLSIFWNEPVGLGTDFFRPKVWQERMRVRVNKIEKRGIGLVSCMAIPPYCPLEIGISGRGSGIRKKANFLICICT